jgi:predicted amidophosphoribosyltransferase
MAVAEEPDGYMMEYHPYNGRTNPRHSAGSDSQTLSFLKQKKVYDQGRKADFERKIKKWLRKVLSDTIMTSNDMSPVVVMIAPGHKKGLATNNILYELLGSVLAKLPQLTDGRDFLERTEDVPKSTDGGTRDQKLHEKTISLIAGGDSDVRSKVHVVYIFDDIYTTGATLRACANVVKRAGASNVKIFTVGKTIHAS